MKSLLGALVVTAAFAAPAFGAQAFRDANTAARHLTQNWGINAPAHDRVVIGLPIDNPTL